MFHKAGGAALLFLVSYFFLAQSAFAALFKNSYAVVVGIDHYKSNHWVDLPNSVNDAEGIQDYLESQGFLVKKFHGHEAIKDDILSYLEDNLAPLLTEQDRFLFYFSGHGETLPLGDGDHGYIVPYDGEEGRSSTWISMEKLRELSKKLGAARHQLFIFDSCFGGLFAEKSSMSSVKVTFPDYIRRISSQKARQYLTAGGKGERVPGAGPNPKFSYFTGYLLEALREGKADTYPDGYITAGELHAYLEGAASGSSHTPRGGTISGDEQGNFLFDSPFPAASHQQDNVPEDSVFKSGQDESTKEESRSYGNYPKNVVRQIPIDGRLGIPFLSPDATRLFVNDFRKLNIVNINDNMRVESIEIGELLQTAAMDRTGSTIFVLNSKPSHEFLVIDTKIKKIVKILPFPKLKICNSLVTANGESLLISLPNDNAVYEFNLRQQMKATIYELDADNPCALGMSRHRFQFYVSSGKNEIRVFSFYDLKKNTKVRPKAIIKVGNSPRGIVENASGTRLYVTNMRDASVSVIDLENNTVIATVPVGEGPWGVAVAPDERWIYVANRRSNNISVIDAEINTVVDDIPVDADPIGIAVTPDGRHVYVTSLYSNSINVLE